MNINKYVHESWNPIIGEVFREPLKTFSENILSEISYSPKKEDIFKMFQMPVNTIKVVMIGRYSYPYPSDLVDYSKYIQSEVISSDPENINDSEQIDITSWEKQGVFFLNSSLTVEIGNLEAHKVYWSAFIEKVAQFISSQNPCIWVLWGRYSEKYKFYIKNPIYVNPYERIYIGEIPISEDYNYILNAAHPGIETSIEEQSFIGCDHFYKINKILRKKSFRQIKW